MESREITAALWTVSKNFNVDMDFGQLDTNLLQTCCDDRFF